MIDTRWLVLTWRLPSDSSTPRVATWRMLRRVGAVLLTPGSAVVPYSEGLLERLDFLAHSIEEEGGEAWVLPVLQLSECEEGEIRSSKREALAYELGKHTTAEKRETSHK